MFRTIREAGGTILSALIPGSGKSKWAGLDKGPGYRIEDLGRAAVFCLPSDKLDLNLGGRTVEEALTEFLTMEYGGFSRSFRDQFGVWRDGEEVVHYDRCTVFEVSFVGKERIPRLASVLSVVARGIGEACIYFKAGQYSGLIWPAR